MIHFGSERQERVFDSTIRGIGRLGYRDELTRQDYRFTDWFSPNTAQRYAPAVAFGRAPVAYDSACIAVFVPTVETTAADFRALGAPYALEVGDEGIVPWTIGHDEQLTRPSGNRIAPGAIDRFFDNIENRWKPEAVLRAKNIGTSVGPSEIDWVDLGLIPALESVISEKLDHMLRSALRDAQQTYVSQTGSEPDPERLFRLVFRLLAGKVFHDRGIRGFVRQDAASDPVALLQKVSSYYGEPQNYLGDRSTQCAAAERIWTGLSFQNLSVDALSFIYENTLVDDELRRKGAIHSTPHPIARYIVDRLPLESIPEAERYVVEPCSGHGVFLVAALRRLRDLLPDGLTERSRHNYLKSHLAGFELDPFAREVSRLCLTLADFPNPNGWDLPPADVFRSRKFANGLNQARAVLCNPPFGEFSAAEREKYGSVAITKPLEILERVLRHAHPQACLGFVLPRPFLDGQNFRAVRERLVEKFESIELVDLPDKVFTHADVETALLIASSPIQKGTAARVHFSEVRQTDLPRFLDLGEATRSDEVTISVENASSPGFLVPALQDVWEFLENHPTLGSIASIHRGVEWQPPFDAEKYLSRKRKPGFVRGIRNVEEGFESYSLPPACWLNASKESRRRNAWDLDWKSPKVIVNAARKARGSWRLAAAPDRSALVTTQSYQNIWPTSDWSVECLAAVLNSPVVSAFAASSEGTRHVRKTILKGCPMPKLSASDVIALNGLVTSYISTVNADPSTRLPLFGGHSWEENVRRILLEIDALILDAYGLPPWLERKLLNFFRGETRPVPFSFGDYFPADFHPSIPLSRYISRQFSNSRGSRIVAHLPELRDEELSGVLAEL